MFNIIFLSIGLIAGVAIAYLVIKGGFKFGKEDTTTVTSNSMLLSIERVFKVVTAEGHFAEIYDYQNTSHLLSFIPSTKKALIVVNAKVMMGFDFKKMKMDIDPQTREMVITEFPQPEILSIEPDLKYYNLEDGLFNKFNNQDLTKLQADAKAKIRESALQSELPAIAQRQMQTLLLELTELKQWQLLGQEKITQPLLGQGKKD